MLRTGISAVAILVFTCPLGFASSLALDPSPYHTPGDEASSIDSPGTGSPVLWGLLLGGAGFAVGGVTGALIDDECSDKQFAEWCDFDGAFIGAATGGTIGMALGVHLGNRRQGNLALDALVASAVWGLGMLAFSQTEDDGARFAILVGLPVTQLIATVITEKKTARARHGSRSTSLIVAPTFDGGLQVRGTIVLGKR